MVKYIVGTLLIIAGYFAWDHSKTPAEQPKRLTNEDINSFFRGESNKQEHIVNLYATSWCGYCAKARDFFKKNGVRYKEYDIEKDPVARDQHKKLGGKGIPVIEAGGQVFFGYNEGLLKQLAADSRYKL